MKRHNPLIFRDLDTYIHQDPACSQSCSRRSSSRRCWCSRGNSGSWMPGTRRCRGSKGLTSRGWSPRDKCHCSTPERWRLTRPRPARPDSFCRGKQLYTTSIMPCLLQGNISLILWKRIKIQKKTDPTRENIHTHRPKTSKPTRHHPIIAPYKLRPFLLSTQTQHKPTAQNQREDPTYTQTPDRQHEGSARGKAANRAQRRRKWSGSRRREGGSRPGWRCGSRWRRPTRRQSERSPLRRQEEGKWLDT